MSWFEDLTGFREGSYEETRARLKVQKNRLISLENSKSFSIGKLELIALEELRKKAKIANNISGKLKTSLTIGDVRSMHRAPENNGALFQVASQFNLLEMTSPRITPEHGVTRYQNDPTQGPACGQMSILDAFANNSTKIQSLTDASAITVSIGDWCQG